MQRCAWSSPSVTEWSEWRSPVWSQCKFDFPALRGWHSHMMFCTLLPAVVGSSMEDAIPGSSSASLSSNVSELRRFTRGECCPTWPARSACSCSGFWLRCPRLWGFMVSWWFSVAVDSVRHMRFHGSTEHSLLVITTCVWKERVPGCPLATFLTKLGPRVHSLGAMASNCWLLCLGLHTWQLQGIYILKRFFCHS